MSLKRSKECILGDIWEKLFCNNFVDDILKWESLQKS